MVSEKILESSSKESFWNISPSWGDSARFTVGVFLIFDLMTSPEFSRWSLMYQLYPENSDLLWDFDPRRPKISKTSFDMNKVEGAIVQG